MLILGGLIGYFAPRFKILFIILFLFILWNLDKFYEVYPFGSDVMEHLIFIAVGIFMSMIMSLNFIFGWLVGCFFKKIVFN